MAAPDSRSDQQLVAAANGGDAGAMEEIYRRHRDWALRLAWRFTGDHDLAMDVVQEAFIYLFGKFGRGGSGLVLTAKLTTLLYPAIKNTALAARRKKRPLSLGPEYEAGSDTAPGPAAFAGGPLEHDEQSRALWGMLAQLSDGHREVVLMKIVDGMEHTEIAAALGIPEGTVKSRLHHALAALRAAAAADSGPGEPQQRIPVERQARPAH